MIDKPEALQLADYLDNEDFMMSAKHIIEAAAELRRLHEAHDWQYKMAGERLRRIEKLERQRDVLLEALKIALRQNEHDMVMTGEECRRCRAAIAKAEENT